MTPDLITFAKGITSGTVPMGGVLAKREIYRTFMEASAAGVELFHGYTYSGHPLAAAAALATLDTYAEEGLFERANELARYFEDGVHSFRGLPHVVDCRNLQLIGAVELAPRSGAAGARALEVHARAWDRGVFVRAIGDAIAFCPRSSRRRSTSTRCSAWSPRSSARLPEYSARAIFGRHAGSGDTHQRGAFLAGRERAPARRGGEGRPRMRIFFCRDQLAHRPESFMMAGVFVPHLESPERCERVVAALGRASYNVEQPRRDFPLDRIARVHAPGYVEFLQTAWQRWSGLKNAGPAILPSSHPYCGAGDDLAPRRGPRASSLVGQAGHYIGDLSCAMGPDTWTSALAAAHTALAAAECVLAGEHAAYALCRPPGHHAAVDRASGFCFLNNAAIAAEFMLQHFRRVAILDVDTHHGDGTQSIFYRRAEVQFVSIHVDPTDYYPFFSGYADEYGAGEGEGATSTSRCSRAAAMPISSMRSTRRSRRSAPTAPRRCSCRWGSMRTSAIRCRFSRSPMTATAGSAMRSRA